MKNEQQSQNLLLKVEPLCTFRNNFLQPATNIFVPQQVDHVRWKTPKFATKQCCATSWGFLYLVLRYLNGVTITEIQQLRIGDSQLNGAQDKPHWMCTRTTNVIVKVMCFWGFSEESIRGYWGEVNQKVYASRSSVHKLSIFCQNSFWRVINMTWYFLKTKV